MTLIRDITVYSPSFKAETLGEEIYEWFKSEPDFLLAPIVDGHGRPIGLVERHSFFLRMASQYGRALYAPRPISMMMDPNPLIVEGDRDISDFTAATLSARASDLMGGFIVAEDGLYAGVGGALSLLRAASDETERSALEVRSLAERLQAAKVFTDTIVENIPAMLFVKSFDDDRFVLVNRAVEETLGYSREELVGRRAADIFSAETAALIRIQDESLIASGENLFIDDERLRRKDGEERQFSTRKLAVPDRTGAAHWIVSVSEDITERKRAEARVERLAHYDALTGLANRTLFKDELEAALQLAAREDQSAAVYCIDLDHFKAVNDTLGHAAGDTLLTLVADRLTQCVRAGDTVARLGGDEFAIVQRGSGLAEISRELAARVVAALSEPYDINGHHVVIGASIGIALFPIDGRLAGDLLKKADVALYRAKAHGRGAYRVFTPEMDAELQARRSLEVDLRHALTAGEFELHYQPLLDLKTDQVVGCEALIRWNHPTRGLVMPGDFIALTEEIGLIRPIGEWVLRAACTEAATWPEHVTLAVNVSAVQFRDRHLAGTIMSALATSGLAATRLELEITESVLLQDDEANMRVLHQLKLLGCRISLDDFGTGYSSLSYLRRFPFDKIKIDRCFVRDLPDDQGSVAIIQAITHLAASLGMCTTAEGVETLDQLDILERLGCNQAQGYVIGRPTPASKIRQAFESRSNLLGRRAA
jgi:diguanylate cyclase (GGDEF)-like protein/PAS domain S-box-containing protein